MQRLILLCLEQANVTDLYPGQRARQHQPPDQKQGEEDVGHRRRDPHHLPCNLNHVPIYVVATLSPLSNNI